MPGTLLNTPSYKRLRYRLGHLSWSLIDLRVRLERSPGEPKVVAMNYRRQHFPSQRALCCLSQNVPDTARLVVNEAVALGSKGELAAVQVGFEHAGGSHRIGGTNEQAIESGEGPRLEKDHHVQAANGVVDHPLGVRAM